MSKQPVSILESLRNLQARIQPADQLARQLGYDSLSDIAKHLDPTDTILADPTKGKLVIETQDGTRIPVRRNPGFILN